MVNRDFKGVWIPKEIYLDERLTALDKIILVEIDSLDDGKTGCFASNEYLADFCQCSKAKVTSAISKLIECGYLEQIGFDGRRRILRSRLLKSSRQNTKKYKAESEKVGHNNIENKKENKNIPPTIDEVREYCKIRHNGIDAEAFIDYYQQQGWKLANGNKMKDWQAAVRTWEKRDKKTESHEPRSKVYKEFEPEAEIDAVQMPDEIRERLNKIF